MGLYLFGVATGLGLWASWHRWPETMPDLFMAAMLLPVLACFLILIFRAVRGAIQILPEAWRNITGKDKL